METVCVHYCIPEMIKGDIESVLSIVDKTIYSTFKASSGRRREVLLDIPQHFFISTHLAKKFDDLIESAIVTAFQSYFPPGRMTSDWRSSTNSSSFGLGTPRQGSLAVILKQRISTVVFSMWAMQLIGTIPHRQQRIVIHILQPTLLFSLFYMVEQMIVYPIIAAFIGAVILYEVARVYVCIDSKSVQPDESCAESNPAAEDEDEESVKEEENLASAGELIASANNRWRSASRVDSLLSTSRPTSFMGEDNRWEDSSGEDGLFDDSFDVYSTAMISRHFPEEILSDIKSDGENVLLSPSPLPINAMGGGGDVFCGTTHTREEGEEESKLRAVNSLMEMMDDPEIADAPDEPAYDGYWEDASDDSDLWK